MPFRRSGVAIVLPMGCIIRRPSAHHPTPATKFLPLPSIPCLGPKKVGYIVALKSMIAPLQFPTMQEISSLLLSRRLPAQSIRLQSLHHLKTPVLLTPITILVLLGTKVWGVQSWLATVLPILVILAPLQLSCRLPERIESTQGIPSLLLSRRPPELEFLAIAPPVLKPVRMSVIRILRTTAAGIDTIPAGTPLLLLRRLPARSI
jgi:hypothetical protein